MSTVDNILILLLTKTVQDIPNGTIIIFLNVEQHQWSQKAKCSVSADMHISGVFGTTFKVSRYLAYDAKTDPPCTLPSVI